MRGVSYTPKELLKFSNIYKAEIQGKYMGIDIKVWDNGRRNKMDQAEFIVMCLLRRDSTLNVATWGV